MEADLYKANLIEVDLSGATLIEADLIRANLKRANLTQAKLFAVKMGGANLSRANLMGADLQGAKLSRANFANATLTDANLMGSILIMATFTESDISGANLNDANLSQWIIKGIKCSHVIWNGKELNFKEGEFEKAFTTIEKTVEMILDIPFSDLSHYTGGVIEQAINQKYGEGSLLFRGQTALSNHMTKYEFINFGTDEQLKEIQGRLSDIQDQLKPFIDETKANHEPKSVIDIKEEIDIPFAKGLIVRPKEVARLLNERHAKMHPLLQKTILAVQAAIQ
jgi:hypothetical protein